MTKKIEIIDNEIRKYLEQMKKTCTPRLFEAMEYSLFPGGKRLRPVILLATCEAFGGDLQDALPFACALEIIHTYSLIHDDLPAMDDDDIRRGKASNHKVFGEAMAILAGDALLNFAYEIMAAHCIENPQGNFLFAMGKIAECAGFSGMVGGQALEFALAETAPTEDDIVEIYINKTAKLFMAGFAAGALCAGADSAKVAEMENIGENLGIAFQIMDDFDDGNPPFHLTTLGENRAKSMLEESLTLVNSAFGKYDFLKQLVQHMSKTA